MDTWLQQYQYNNASAYWNQQDQYDNASAYCNQQYQYDNASAYCYQQYQYDTAGAYRNQQYDHLWTSDPYNANTYHGGQGSYYQYPQQQSMFEGNYPKTCTENVDGTVSSGSNMSCMDELFDSLPWLRGYTEEKEIPMEAPSKHKRLEADSSIQDIVQQQPDNSMLYDASEIGAAPNYCRPSSETHTVLENTVSDDSTLLPVTSHGLQKETVSHVQGLHTTSDSNMNVSLIIPILKSPIAITENTPAHPLSDKARERKIKQKHNYRCSLCNKTFVAKVSFQAHMNRHSGIRAHACDICNQSFFSRSKMLSHKAAHNKSLTCSNCGSSFKWKQSLYLHLVSLACTHANKYISECSNGIWKFSCSKCSKLFRTKESALYHARFTRHERRLGIPCPVCPENFSVVKSSALVKHCKREHPEYFQTLVANNEQSCQVRQAQENTEATLSCVSRELQ